MATTKWAGYPIAKVRDDQGEVVDTLLWGREVRVTSAPTGGKVRVEVPKALPSGSSNPQVPAVKGWMREADLAGAPVLEVVFVDIGQGDGCLLVMPDGRRMVVDAGEGDNMLRFLKWRFGDFGLGPPFEVVISHSDMDHYLGFKALFGDPDFRASVVYHNGLVERAGPKVLGNQAAVGGKTYQVELISDTAMMDAILGSSALVGGKKYPSMLKNARGQIGAFQALGITMGSASRRFVPGYEQGKAVEIEVLGPVREAAGGQEGLRRLGDDNKTKNGHSVVLRLTIGNVRMLLGGDLNSPAANLLLQAHTGMASPPPDAGAADALVQAARAKLRCDIAKACHHGSADFTDLFYRSVHPIATVISSGDEESYAHPRPDALGTLGGCSRGVRPLIFSTELARSSAERIKHPNKFRRELAEIFNQYAEAYKAQDQAKADRARQRFDKKLLDIQRSVSVYGAINVRTDGTKALLAYMLESPSPNRKWDLYQLEPDAGGELAFVPEH